MLYDLLSPVPGTQESLQIVDEGGATVVKGLTQVQVFTQKEALALLFEGDKPFHDRCVFVSLQVSCFAAIEEECILIIESIAPLHCTMCLCLRPCSYGTLVSSVVLLIRSVSYAALQQAWLVGYCPILLCSLS